MVDEKITVPVQDAQQHIQRLAIIRRPGFSFVIDRNREPFDHNGRLAIRWEAAILQPRLPA
ncbi:MAG: hypothetical protein U1F42_03200 [Candidatus Competibacteraceae bacterium]